MDQLRSTIAESQRRQSKRGLVFRFSRYWGIWTIVVLLFTAQWYTHDALLQSPWPWTVYLQWSMVEWYTWAALAPIVFRLTARYPIDLPLRLHVLGVHLLASVMITLVAVVAGAVITDVLMPTTLREQLAQFFSKHVATGFLTYWALVSIRQTVHFYREKTRRELQASRLAAELAQSRLQILKVQLQPHFLFNTLHAIVTLIDEDSAAAEDMLLRLSELLRAFLENSDEQEISLRRELALLDLYLGIQSKRFKDRLTSTVSAAEQTLDCAVPTLILQPLVENAIKHGIGRNVGADVIDVQCYREGDRLCLDVSNRNSTLDVDPTTLFKRGIGLSNSRLRLTELYGDAAEIRLEAMLPRGVACRIRLPFRPAPAPRVSPSQEFA